MSAESAMNDELVGVGGDAPRGIGPFEPARLLPAVSLASYGEHLARYGPLPTRVDGLVDAVAASGLGGRGGAGFPTGTKLRAVAAGRRAPIVVANGTEGEPASAKDKVLLRHAPHLVLDGIEQTAAALGAREAILCVDRAHGDVIDSVGRALAERPGRRPKIQLATAPDRYVSGEESALVSWLNGGEAKPAFVPPRPFERGVRGRPTMLSNVETYAHIALIARYGPDWFRSLGSANAPGTVLTTVAGAVASPCVCETPGGWPLAALLDTAGGPVDGVQAVLVGGYFGTWVTPDALDHLTLDPAALASVGASTGCGLLAVLPIHSCPLREVARVTRWLADQGAGQCGPCVYGLDAIARTVEIEAEGRSAHSGDVRPLLDLVRGRGACRHPDGVARFVDSSLRVFADHVTAHRRHGPCAPGPAWLPTPATGGWR
jgi:NADH:ubiquinone oxidoreductase subunit F (NADH-binding)